MRTSPLLSLRIAAWLAACWGLLGGSIGVAYADDPLGGAAQPALHKAATFMVERAAREGGYLWVYSADLAVAEGEQKASNTMVWVQPPGTPSVGMALLTCYRLTGDDYYRNGARQTAECLIRGQLASGGWGYSIDFNPEQRKRYAYRVDGQHDNQARNVSVLDDDNTQSVLRFLIELDAELEFSDARLHEAIVYALDKLVACQYPNGAWPQQFSGPPVAADHPVIKANYPESWPRQWPNERYRDYYTFNDNTIIDMIDLMLLAAQVYDNPRYRQSAIAGGDFILLAQMPEPQPAWAQQYNAAMQPVWARRFEPASITGGESQGILSGLMRLYAATGEERFLTPVPRAIEFLKSCELPGGFLPRFIELHTNRPLYFTTDYVLTYDDSDLPTHYGFKVRSNLERIEHTYTRMKAMSPDELGPPSREFRLPRMSSGLVNAARQALEKLDDQGRWTQPGRLRSVDRGDELVITTRTFIINAVALANYIGALRNENK